MTTWPEVGASPAAETFAFELHDTQLQLGPIFQRGFKRDADRIVTIIRIMRGASRSRICGPQATSCSRTMHRATIFLPAPCQGGRALGALEAQEPEQSRPRPTTAAGNVTITGTMGPWDEPRSSRTVFLGTTFPARSSIRGP